jgi:ribosomal protein S18 acetylase RimI-like enzyme
MPPVDADLVRTAHADAWQEIGRHREPYGGGAIELAGVRLMASGIPVGHLNGGDVDDPDAVDLDAVRRWYADRGMPWGLLVPAGVRWPHGTWRLSKREMAVLPEDYRPVAVPAGVRIRTQSAADVDEAATVDAIAFDHDVESGRAWMAPFVQQPTAVTAVAEDGARIVGAGHLVVTDDRAGPAAYVGGIAVLPDARRRGIGAALTSWLLDSGFEHGARFAHLQPEPMAAGVYLRLGFMEFDGWDVYVDMA